MANRISQVTPELVVKPNPDARVSQVTCELVLNTNPHGRLSQLAVEVLLPNVPPTQEIVVQFVCP